MFIDTTRFPIVWMHFTGHESEQTLEQVVTLFDGALDRGDPFVIIGAGANGPPPRRDPAEAKQFNLWFKKTRPRLTQCRSMIVLQPSAVKRFALNPFLKVFSRFWPCPVLLIASEAEALEIAKERLAAPA